jgi:hypothetical protein
VEAGGAREVFLAPAALGSGCLEVRGEALERFHRVSLCRLAQVAKSQIVNPMAKLAEGHGEVSIVKKTVIGDDGQVRCPKCGAINSFTAQHTRKAKAGIGLGTLFAAPKLRCNGCGEFLKPGSPPKRQRTSNPGVPTLSKEDHAAFIAEMKHAQQASHDGATIYRCERFRHPMLNARPTCPLDGSPVTGD